MWIFLKNGIYNLAKCLSGEGMGYKVGLQPQGLEII